MHKAQYKGVLSVFSANNMSLRTRGAIKSPAWRVH